MPRTMMKFLRVNQAFPIKSFFKIPIILNHLVILSNKKTYELLFITSHLHVPT